MCRNVCVVAVIVVTALFSSQQVMAGKKYDEDLKIAKYSAILGSNRLAQDVNDKKGRILLATASAIEPENEMVLLTEGYLERERKPKFRKTKVTETILLKNMFKRANELLAVSRESNVKVRQLSLLYFLTVEAFRPLDRATILGIMKLRAAGATAELPEFAIMTLDLADMFDQPVAPAEDEPAKLDTNDQWIADAARKLGINRLAADTTDSLGLTLLQLSCLLDPDDEDGLYAMGLLLREQKPKQVTVSTTDANLVKALLEQADKLSSKDEGEDEDQQRALLYYKVAEKIAPDNDDIIVALMKLKKRGITGNLEALLNPRPEQDEEVGFADDDDDDDDDDPLDDAKEEDERPKGPKLTEDQIERIDIETKSYKQLMPRSNGLLQIRIRARAENRSSVEVEGASMALVIVTQHPATKTIFRVEKRVDYEDLKIAAKKDSSDCTLTAIVNRPSSRSTSSSRSRVKYEYYGWVAVLRNAHGQILSVKSSSGRSMLDDVGGEIGKMSTHSTFDPKGRVLTEGDPDKR